MKIKEIFKHCESGRLFFMSDLHYNHFNVLSMDKRSFNSIDEMNSYIVEELKTKLTPGDTLFDLGDLFWSCNIETCKNVLESIPTKNIYKLMGNHDKPEIYIDRDGNSIHKYFKEIADIMDIKVEYNGTLYRVALSHYPIIDYNYMYGGGLHLFGHTHGHMDSWTQNNSRLMVDVGFSASLSKSCGSFLIPFDYIVEHFEKKTSGLKFTKWANEKYHEPEFWNKK